MFGETIHRCIIYIYFPKILEMDRNKEMKNGEDRFPFGSMVKCSIIVFAPIKRDFNKNGGVWLLSNKINFVFKLIWFY